MKTPHQTRDSQSHKPKQFGQALVEFSLILPLLLFLLLGILDYGRILLIYSNASSSVRNAARQGTLVGTITDAQMSPTASEADKVPRYMACATIDNFAQDVFGANINSVDILYFNTEGLDSPQRATLKTNLEALDPTALATLSTADYDCDASGTRGGNPVISEGAIITGDLMVILLNAQIDFITPLLSSVFPSFEITFRAQRTLVESLVLNVEGDDLDGDGLLDEWEFQRFGCVLDNTENTDDPVYLLPDRTLAMRVGQSWSYVSNDPYSNLTPDVPLPYAEGSRPGTPILSNYHIFVSGSLATGNCARENLSESLFDDPTQYDYLDCSDSDPDDGLLDDCIIVATGLFASTSDPDNDGCNNGCEEARGTIPMNYLGGVNPGSDSDGDGLSDASELGLGTNGTLEDTDGDGLLDGEEACEIVNSVDPNICDSSPTGRWTKSDPRLPDSDFDGINDFDEIDPANGSITDPTDDDTDDDGLDDGMEINGFVIDLEIDGITFTTGTIFTDPSASGFDSDGDGISDGAEVNGHTITNAIDGTITVYTHPTDPDTDDDGVCDGPGTGGSCSGIADVNPTKTDTDGDGLDDGQEQLTYNTLADNVNSDADACGLSDGFEMLGDQAVIAGTNPDGDTNLDGDPLVNAMDLDSDTHDTTLVGDGISDCDEVNIYGSNPYHVDSDGDGFTDDVEILPENWCLEIMRPDVFTTATPICGADSGTDSDLDGFPDAWEELYFGPTGANLTNPLDAAEQATVDDNDDCNLQCEFDRRTDPTKFDTDNDGIRDGWETGSNPLIRDTDGDGLIDGLESSDTCLDLTALGLIDPPPSPAYTAADCYATNPLLTDSDNDGLSDGEELVDMFVVINGVNTNVGTTDPTDPDTDNDGLLDGEEIDGVLVNTTINGVAVSQMIPSNPNSLDGDTDGDGLQDYLESKIYRTFANDSDTDNDLVQDGSTLAIIGELPNSFDDSLDYYDTNPLEADTDNDGLTDRQEIDGFDVIITTYDADGVQIASTTRTILGYDIANPFSTTNLSPRISDTDGDGMIDGTETNNANGTVTNPTDPNTDGDVDGVGNPIVDGVDNCPIHVNPDQQDLDGNGIGSACETETAVNLFVTPITDTSSLIDATTWTPSVMVKAVNDFGQAQSDVLIEVTFTPNVGVAVVETCTTISGECTVDMGSQSQATITDVVATVTNVTNVPVDLEYDASDPGNAAPLAIEVPPLSVRVTAMTGFVASGSTLSSWEAEATVTVEDDFGNPVNGVSVEVTFTDNDGLVDTVSCPSTDASGQCTVLSGTASLDDTDPDVTAEVTNITNLGGYAYIPANNVVSSVVVDAPPFHVVVNNFNATNGNSWNYSFAINVNDGSSNISGRTVSYDIVTRTQNGNGAGATVVTSNSNDTCTSPCSISSGTLDGQNDGAVLSVQYTITGVSGSGTYDPTANVVTGPATGGGAVVINSTNPADFTLSE